MSDKTSTKPKKKAPGKVQVKVLKPDAADADLPLVIREQQLRQAYFQKITRRRALKKNYDVDWGETVVDQGLADDPGPINSGNFKPVRRWLVAFRSPEAGNDGTTSVTVTSLRTAISGSGSSVIQQFIVHSYHVWLAPNTVSTHFSGVLFTQDDEANGLLGGQYSDIAPWGEFVKFRVRFRGEGQVCDATTSGNQVLLAVGGSQKYNALVYALVSCYN